MNGRKAREQRRQERHRLEVALRLMKEERAQFIGVRDGMEVWQKGWATLQLPPVADTYPEDLRAAVRRYRDACLSGRCACGFEMRVTRCGEYELQHAADCSAGPGLLLRLITEGGADFTRIGGPPEGA